MDASSLPSAPAAEKSATRPRVLLVGEEGAGVLALKSLATGPCVIAGVLTSDVEGKSPVSVGGIARRLQYPVWPAERVRDPAFAEWIRGEQVDLLLNVHSLYIVRPEVLAAPRLGAFNMHPGPLPRYAGLNCVSWAIYRDEKEYGVTIHYMESAIDSGDIVYQALFAVDDSDTPLSLSIKCMKAGVPLLMKLVETAAQGPGALPRDAQDLSLRQYFGKDVPQQGRLLWDRPAREVFNFIRACDYAMYRSPWGHPRVSIGGREVEVVKALPTGERADARPGTVGEADADGVRVACRDEWISVRSVVIDGKRVKPAEVLRPGDPFEDTTEATVTTMATLAAVVVVSLVAQLALFGNAVYSCWIFFLEDFISAAQASMLGSSSFWFMRSKSRTAFAGGKKPVPELRLQS